MRAQYRRGLWFFTMKSTKCMKAKGTHRRVGVLREISRRYVTECSLYDFPAMNRRALLKRRDAVPCMAIDLRPGSSAARSVFAELLDRRVAAER
jgi:hypothetical protein